MPLIQRNRLTLNNLVYTTGNYINPPWIVSLSPAKVGNGIAQWNASQLQGYNISTGIPISGTTLSWNQASGQWISSGIPIPVGGLEGQIISKKTDANYDIQWIDNYTPDVRIICKNDSGANILRGEVVMAVGAVGDRIKIAKAVGDGSIDPKYMVGVAYQDINNGSEGYVTLVGEITNINTSYPIGTLLWMSETIAGGFTATEPSAPNIRMSIAIVTRQHATTGRIFVRMWTQQPSLYDLFDTAISNPQSGDILVYSSGAWHNSTVAGQIGDTGATGVTGSIGGTGATGFIGGTGATGVTGFIGGTGATGVIGFVGATGPGTIISGTGNYIRIYSGNTITIMPQGVGYIDTTNRRLGINTKTPDYALDIVSATTSVPSVGQFKWTGASQFGSLVFVENTTWFGSFQCIGSAFGDTTRRNNFEIINGRSNGNISFMVNGASTATMTVTTSNAIGINTTSPGAALGVVPISNATKGLLVKGAASQSANLFEVQNASNTVLSLIDSLGQISGVALNVASGIALPSSIPVVTTSKLYSNGVKLYWHGSAINNTSSSGNILTGNVMLDGTISGTLSNTNLTTIDFTPYSSGDCVKYIVKAKYGTAVQASEILIISDGTESYMTEYGLIYTSGLLAEISTSYSSSNILLSAQATYSNTSISIFKTIIS